MNDNEILQNKLIDRWLSSPINPFDSRVNLLSADIQQLSQYEKASSYLSRGAKGSLLSFCITGRPGSGKSVFLSRLASDATKERPTAIVDLNDPVFRDPNTSERSKSIYFFYHLLTEYCKSVQNFVEKDVRNSVQKFEDLLCHSRLSQSSQDIPFESEAGEILSALNAWPMSHTSVGSSSSLCLDMISSGLESFFSTFADGLNPLLFIDGLHLVPGTGIAPLLELLNVPIGAPKCWSSNRIQFVCSLQERFVSDWSGLEPECMHDAYQGSAAMLDNQMAERFYKSLIRIRMPKSCLGDIVFEDHQFDVKQIPIVWTLVKESLCRLNDEGYQLSEDQLPTCVNRIIKGTEEEMGKEYVQRKRRGEIDDVEAFSTRWKTQSRRTILNELLILFELQQKKYLSSNASSDDKADLVVPPLLKHTENFEADVDEAFSDTNSHPIVKFLNNSEEFENSICYLLASILNPATQGDDGVLYREAEGLFLSARSRELSTLWYFVEKDEDFIDLVLRARDAGLLQVVVHDNPESQKITREFLAERVDSCYLKSIWAKELSNKAAVASAKNYARRPLAFEGDSDRFKQDRDFQSLGLSPQFSADAVQDHVSNFVFKFCSRITAGDIRYVCQPHDPSAILFKDVFDVDPSIISFLAQSPILYLSGEPHLGSLPNKNLFALLQPNVSNERLLTNTCFDSASFDVVERKFKRLLQDHPLINDDAILHLSLPSDFDPTKEYEPSFLIFQIAFMFRFCFFSSSHPLLQKEILSPERFSSLLPSFDASNVRHFASERALPLGFLSVLTQHEGHQYLTTAQFKSSIDDPRRSTADKALVAYNAFISSSLRKEVCSDSFSHFEFLKDSLKKLLFDLESELRQDESPSESQQWVMLNPSKSDQGLFVDGIENVRREDWIAFIESKIEICCS